MSIAFMTIIVVHWLIGVYSLAFSGMQNECKTGRNELQTEEWVHLGSGTKGIQHDNSPRMQGKGKQYKN